MPLEPRELNRRIAERLGMELGANTGRPKCSRCGVDVTRPRCLLELGSYCPRFDDEQEWKEASQPPDWAGDLETANTLENELINRSKTNQFIYALRNIVLKGSVGPSDVTEYYICFASAYDRAAAALLALGGPLDE